MKKKFLNKSVLKITQDAEKSLSALTPNELNKPLNAFLDKYGKLVVLADQLQHQEAVYLAIPVQYESLFLQHLEPYLRLSRAGIEKTKLLAAHILAQEKLSNMMIPQNLGYIAFLENLEQLSPLKELSDEEYTKIRIENSIPMQGIDFQHEMFLEVNLPEAISYTKGCYLGQEIIARVHHKSKPVRLLQRILYEKLPENNLVKSQGEEIGKITSSCFSEKYKCWLCLAMIKNQNGEIDGGKLRL